MAANEPIIERGKRAVVAGRTGSGKSTLARWLLVRSPGHWVILNPKHTAAYNTLPDSVVLKSMSDYNRLDKAIREHKFVIVNPRLEESDWDEMDDFIGYLHETYTNIGVCVDELYSVHNNGRAGRGLLGLLTRGRELKQSFLGLTQRPAFLSKFCFTEADYVGGMTLLTDDDRKMMAKNTGQNSFSDQIDEKDWLWFEAAKKRIRFFGPVPI